VNLKIYNFLTRRKEPFKPIKKGLVGFYACGPTVYNYAHIGNFRTYIFEDVLRRTLEYAGYKVKHVMNITDVGHLTSDADAGEDKIEKEARKEKKSVWNIAKFYEKAFFADIDALHIKQAELIVRATDSIKTQIKIIKILIKKKYAYETSTAVYFHVPKFKNYSRYSRQPLKNLIIGARAEVVSDNEKKHPADFVLWFKAVGRFQNHVMRWPSPWGDGFPGWHIECSAISSENLGQPFDIHAGGVDHIFPHHTNEIAQSEAAYGKKLAHFWLEGEHLIIDSKRMGKSLGNFYILRDLEKKEFWPESFRYLVLSAHYRSQLNFTLESLQSAENAFLGLTIFISRLKADLAQSVKRISVFRTLNRFQVNFQKAVFDDLNTPKALAVMWNLVHEYNKNSKKFNPKDILALFYDFDKVLGLGFANIGPEALSTEAQKLLKEREKARKAGDFKKADEIRLQIKHLGWQVSDTTGGSQLFHL